VATRPAPEFWNDLAARKKPTEIFLYEPLGLRTLNLFDARDDGGAILFFDEADALFGKRSVVKDSQHGYANIEILEIHYPREGVLDLSVDCSTFEFEPLDSPLREW
jgi:hypothetical protein